MSTIDLVSNKLFEEIKQEYDKYGELSDSHISALNCMFGQPLLAALDLVDNSAVTHIVSPSEKEVYQVCSNSGRKYTCPASLQFCPCMSFAFGVIKRGELITCKHVLAILLSKAMGLCTVVEKSDEEISIILFQQEY
ncbi:zinc finger SWIM domain-containing protein 7-like isoform X1 [Ciona intestinalis]